MNLEGIDEFITRDLQDATKTRLRDNSYTEVLRSCLRDVKRAQNVGYLTEKSDNERNSGAFDQPQKSSFQKNRPVNDGALPYESELDELFSQELDCSSQSSLALVPPGRIMQEINCSDKVMASLKAERDELMRKYVAERDGSAQKDRQIQELRAQLELMKRDFSSTNEELLDRKNELSLARSELYETNRQLSLKTEALSQKEDQLSQAQRELSQVQTELSGVKAGPKSSHELLELVPLRVYADQQSVLKLCEQKNDDLKRENTQLQVKNRELETSIGFERQKFKNQGAELRAFCERLREKLSKYKYLYDESASACTCGAVVSATNSWTVNGAIQGKHANVPAPEKVSPPEHAPKLTNETPKSDTPQVGTKAAEQAPPLPETCGPCSRSLQGAREDKGSLRGKFHWQIVEY